MKKRAYWYVLLSLTGSCSACLAAPGPPQLLEWLQMRPIPGQHGIAGPFAGVSGGALIVAGGADFTKGPQWQGGSKVFHDTVYVLTVPEGEWRVAGRLPRALGYGISVTTPGGVACIGGRDSHGHYADAFLLSWDGSEPRIRPLAALPVPLAYAGGALLANRVLICGGSHDPRERSASNRLFALDLSHPSSTWEELEPCPGAPRILPVAAVQAGSFYVAGGCALGLSEGRTVRLYLRDTWRYSPGSGWKRVADLPHSIAAAPSPAPAIGQSHFLLLGGDDGSGIEVGSLDRHAGFSREILAYHIITDTWMSLGNSPAPRVAAPVVEWKGLSVIPGGELRPGPPSREVWALTVRRERAGFGWLNYTTLALYLAAMVWLGSSFVRRNRTTDDFFRGGRRVPWWAAGLSIFATMLSSITFMAVPAQSYSVGWNLFLGNSYILLTPLVVLVYLPFYRRLDVTSAYEYLERRFNPAVRLLASALFILFQLGRIAIVLYLPALALAAVSSFEVHTCILLMGLLCILYTVLGGIEAVIWTDAAQALILMGGAVWALITIVGRVEGGLGALVSTAAAQERLFGTLRWDWDYAAGTAWIIMFGSIFANLFSYTASQDVIQRYLTTADEKSAARAIWTNTLVSPIAQALFFAIGTALFVFYRQHPDRLDPTLQTDGIFPMFIVNELPAGLAGLMVAGIFAAAQSTLSSSLNSTATAWITDFHRRFRPLASDESCLRLARALTAAVGIAGTCAALALATFDIRSLWETFLGIIGLFGGTISGLFVLGIFSRRASGTGAIAGGVLSMILVSSLRQFTPAHFFVYPVAGVASCVAIGWLGSVVFPRRNTIDGLTVHELRKHGPPLIRADAKG